MAAGAETRSRELTVGGRYTSPLGRLCKLAEVARTGRWATFEYLDGDREGVTETLTLMAENWWCMRPLTVAPTTCARWCHDPSSSARPAEKSPAPARPAPGTTS